MPSSMTWMCLSPSLSGKPTSDVDRVKLETWTDTVISVLVTVSPLPDDTTVSGGAVILSESVWHQDDARRKRERAQTSHKAAP